MWLTWSNVFPATSIPFTSRTSSFTASRPVDSARPPGTSREIKTPGIFSKPVNATDNRKMTAHNQMVWQLTVLCNLYTAAISYVKPQRLVRAVFEQAHPPTGFRHNVHIDNGGHLPKIVRIGNGQSLRPGGRASQYGWDEGAGLHCAVTI